MEWKEEKKIKYKRIRIEKKLVKFTQDTFVYVHMYIESLKNVISMFLYI